MVICVHKRTLECTLRTKGNVEICDQTNFRDFTNKDTVTGREKTERQEISLELVERRRKCTHGIKQYIKRLGGERKRKKSGH